MAEGATDHAGTLGASLDAIVPASKGAPPFSYLLAAWVNTGTSIGAEAVRANMGKQVWTDAPALVFPTIGLSLFAADSIKAVGVTSGPRDVPLGHANAGRARGSTPTIVVNAPCSLVSNFLQKVIDAVFDNLKLNGPTGSTVTAKIGSFFVNLWNTAVSYAKSAVTGLTSAVLNVIVGKITAAAAAAATIAEVVSNITPWSVRVAAVPTSVDFGSSGTFNATASSGGGIDYPPAVQDCAQKLNITLPKLNAKGAKATWTVAGPLSPTSSTSVTLDAGGSSTLNYETTKSSPTCAVVPEETGEGTITITRPAVDQLKTLVGTWLTSLLSAAGPIVKPLLQPLINSLSSKLESLTQVSSTGTVTVRNPAGTGGPQTNCPCIIGTWRVVNETVKVSTVETLTGGAGATWDLSSDGDATINHSGSGALTGGGGSFTISVQYTGLETGKFTIPSDASATSGTWSITPLSSDVIATTKVAGTTKTEPVPIDIGAAEQGDWRCEGDAMTSGLIDSSGISENVDLVRVTN